MVSVTQSHHRQHGNKGAWPCSNKTLLLETESEFHICFTWHKMLFFSIFSTVIKCKKHFLTHRVYKNRQQGQIWPMSLSLPTLWKSQLPRMFIFDTEIFICMENLGASKLKICSSKSFMNIRIYEMRIKICGHVPQCQFDQLHLAPSRRQRFR